MAAHAPAFSPDRQSPPAIATIAQTLLIAIALLVGAAAVTGIDTVALRLTAAWTKVQQLSRTFEPSLDPKARYNDQSTGSAVDAHGSPLPQVGTGKLQPVNLRITTQAQSDRQGLTTQP